jgi:SAM-dependent methyltransferase
VSSPRISGSPSLKGADASLKPATSGLMRARKSDPCGHAGAPLVGVPQTSAVPSSIKHALPSEALARQALGAHPPHDYGANADDYALYRPQYPAAIWDLLVEAVGGSAGRVVDIGAGTGQATEALAQRFDNVIAVEPDDAMAAHIPRVGGKVSVLAQTAETVVIDDASCDAVVFANSLHWVDAEAVFARARRWLRPNGVVMALITGPARIELGAQGDVLMQHSRTLWRRFVDERMVQFPGCAEALRLQGKFQDVTPFAAPSDYTWSADAFAGFLFTGSAAADWLALQPNPGASRADLSAELNRLSAGRKIAVRIMIEGAIARV